MPGIDSTGMAIVPVEADGIAPDRVCFVGAYGRFEQGKRGFGLGLLLSRLASGGFSFFNAQRARARRTQPCEGPLAGVSVFPDDLHASPFRLVDADSLRINGFAR